MNQPAPPVLDEGSSAPRWAWLVMLALMSGYIGSMTALAAVHKDAGPALSGGLADLMRQTGTSLGLFAVPFLAGLACVWRGRRELLGHRRHDFWTWTWGALWFVGLRVAVALPIMAAAVVVQLRHGADAMEKVRGLRPKIESLMPLDSLGDPWFALACVTWVSFVVAGLREELWRAAFMRGFRALFGTKHSAATIQWTAVAVSSVLFGLAHLPQGWMGMLITGMLGLGLGAVQVARRSTWEAVVAHGLVDASTFALLFVLHNPAMQRWLAIPPDFAKQVLGG
jgi:membrane protease YdiL (CAAX protease family)